MPKIWMICVTVKYIYICISNLCAIIFPIFCIIQITKKPADNLGQTQTFYTAVIMNTVGCCCWWLWLWHSLCNPCESQMLHICIDSVRRGVVTVIQVCANRCSICWWSEAWQTSDDGTMQPLGHQGMRVIFWLFLTFNHNFIRMLIYAHVVESSSLTTSVFNCYVGHIYFPQLDLEQMLTEQPSTLPHTVPGNLLLRQVSTTQLHCFWTF